ncbi:MAG: trypsin-like serine protease [Asticcacaulis sp.]
MRAWLMIAALLSLPVAAEAGRVSTPPPASKVVGGQYADPAHWPGFAALGVRRPDGTIKLICGATMIGARHALTAAHCVENYDTALAARCRTKLQPTAQLLLFPGLVDMNKAGDDEAYQAVKVTANPGAHCEDELDQGDKKPTYDNDLAIIEVDHDYKGQVSALSLSADTDPDSGLTAVAGMGTTESEQSNLYPARDGMQVEALSDRLLEAFLPLVPTEACSDARQGAGGVIGAHQICAGWVAPAASQAIGDSCSGDSGGPLMAYDGAHRPYQVGLVSWGPSPCGAVGYPGVYTRLSAYAPWIKSIVGDVPAAEPAAAIQEAPTEAAGFKALQAQLAPADGRIQVDICDDTSGECGLTQLHAGQRIQLKVSSPLSGRLILIDSNAEFKITQVFPNALASNSSATNGFITANVPVLFPDASLGFEIEAQVPYGASRLMAVLAPPGANLEDFVASDGVKSKGVNVTYEPGWDSQTGADFYAANLANQVNAEVDPATAKDAALPGWGLAVLNYEIVQ